MSLSDLNLLTLAEHGEWFLRIICAAICGCFIGYERVNKNKEAGIKTHAIVALGSALIMIISKYGFADVANSDGSRIAAQIVSGVGFLGTGVIFFRGGAISGLTTAAGIWATSGVGMCIGAGLYDIGIVSTFFIIFLQILVQKVKFLQVSHLNYNLQLEVSNKKESLLDFQDTLKNDNISVTFIKMEILTDDKVYLNIEVSIPRKMNIDKVMRKIVEKDYVELLFYS